MTTEKKKPALRAKKNMNSKDFASWLELENKKDEIRLMCETKKEKRKQIKERITLRDKKIKSLRMSVYYPERI